MKLTQIKYTLITVTILLSCPAWSITPPDSVTCLYSHRWYLTDEDAGLGIDFANQEVHFYRYQTGTGRRHLVINRTQQMTGLKETTTLRNPEMTQLKRQVDNASLAYEMYEFNASGERVEMIHVQRTSRDLLYLSTWGQKARWRNSSQKQRTQRFADCRMGLLI